MKDPIFKDVCGSNTLWIESKVGEMPCYKDNEIDTDTENDPEKDARNGAKEVEGEVPKVTAKARKPPPRGSQDDRDRGSSKRQRTDIASKNRVVNLLMLKGPNSLALNNASKKRMNAMMLFCVV